MDIEKLNFIRQDVLKVPLIQKEYSDEFCGVLLHSNSPVTRLEYEPVIHSFRAFSKKEYPILFFISDDAVTDDFEWLLAKYSNIKPIQILRLTDIYKFNDFSINNLMYLIPPQYEKLIYQQSDGFTIAPGWEEKTDGYSWLAAPWKEPIQVLENTFNFGPVQIGNGGCHFRRRSKCLEVLDFVNKHGGQRKIVKGVKIGLETKHFNPFLAEDLYFCFFGFNSGIFEPVDIEYAYNFAREPISMAEYIRDPKPCHFFHRIDF